MGGLSTYCSAAGNCVQSDQFFAPGCYVGDWENSFPFVPGYKISVTVDMSSLRTAARSHLHNHHDVFSMSKGLCFILWRSICRARQYSTRLGFISKHNGWKSLPWWNWHSSRAEGFGGEEAVVWRDARSRIIRVSSSISTLACYLFSPNLNYFYLTERSFFWQAAVFNKLHTSSFKT